MNPLIWPNKSRTARQNIYCSSVKIQDVALKTCQKRWTIGRSDERESGISMLAAQHDDEFFKSTLLGIGFQKIFLKILQKYCGKQNKGWLINTNYVEFLMCTEKLFLVHKWNQLRFATISSWSGNTDSCKERVSDAVVWQCDGKWKEPLFSITNSVYKLLG